VAKKANIMVSVLAYAIVLAVAIVVTRLRPSYGLALLIVVDPFDLLSRHVGFTTLAVPKIVLVGVGIGLLRRSGSLDPLFTPPVRMLTCASIAVVVVTAATAIPGLYIDAVVRETLKALEYLALFGVSAIAYARDPDEPTTWLAIAGTVTLVCALAMLQPHFGSTSMAVVGGHLIHRIAGPLEGPNQLAGYLDVGLPMLLAGLLVRRAWEFVPALAIAGIADVLTLSRAGALGAAVGVAAVFARISSRRVRLAAGASIAVAAAAAIAILAHLGALSRIVATDDVDYNSGLGTRSDLWGAALVFFRTHPILGIGAGNYEYELPTLGLIGIRTHANSLYLQSLAEGGIVLFAAVVFAIVVAIRTSYAGRANDAFAIGAGGATIALAAHQVLDDLTFFPKVGGFWWICVGIGAASVAIRARSNAATSAIAA
jgi:O-antigen ligase